MIRVFSLFLLLSNVLHAQTDSEGKIIALRGATIYTSKGDPIQGGTLLVQKGKILEIGAKISIPEGAEIVDASGKVIIPGLIDPASFLFLDVKSGSGAGAPEFDVMDEIDPFQEGFQEAVAAGITTVCVLPRATGMSRGLSSVLKLSSDRNRRILRRGAALHFSLSSGTSGSSDSFRRFAQVEALRGLFKGAKAYMEAWEKYRKELAEYAKKKKALAAEKAKKKEGEKKEGEKKAPEAAKKASKLKKPKKPSFNIRYQVLAQSMNPKAPLPVRVEVHHPDSIEWILALAKEYKFRLILDQVSGGAGIINQLVKAKVPVVIGPVFRYGTRGVDYLDHSPRTAFRMQKAGLVVSIGSFPELNEAGATRFLPEAAAWASRGTGNQMEALRMLTLDAAKILGVGKRIGSLEKGKDADLVLLSGNPFSAGRTVERTMINGRWEYTRTSK